MKKNCMRVVLKVLMVCFMSAFVSMSVLNVEAASKMTLSKSSKTLAVGETYQLKAKHVTGKVTFKSSKKSVASVSAKGLIKGKKKGTAKITVTSKKTGQKKICKVRVENIKISDKKKYTIWNSSSQYPYIKLTGTSREVKWTTSNSSVCKIRNMSTNSWVTSLKQDGRQILYYQPNVLGETKITAQVGKMKYTCTVYVISEGEAVASYIKTGKNPFGLNNQVLQSAKTISNTIPTLVNATMSRQEKIAAVHDYIVTSTSYDVASYNSGKIPYYDHSVVGPVLYHIGVCDGYAYTFQAYMLAMDIPCKFIVGRAGSDLHGWNMVQCDDGAWYQVDCTYDDPVASDDSSNSLKYNYFLITDAKMSADHTWDKKVYPTCSGGAYSNFATQYALSKYQINQTQYTREEALQQIADQMKAKNESFYVFYYGDSSSALGSTEVKNKLIQSGISKCQYQMSPSVLGDGILYKVQVVYY